jgi:hypothetical protein
MNILGASYWQNAGRKDDPLSTALTDYGVLPVSAG